MFMKKIMKVVRFVTEAEKELYLSGAKIINNNGHAGQRSTSKGACFAEITPERDADQWLSKLLFIRHCEWVIEFDTDAFTEPLTESIGHYSADRMEDIDAGLTIDVREWCTTIYSLRTHPYTRISRCPSLGGLILGDKIAWR